MKNFRPVSTPLITVDPYFNIWSFADNLYDSTTRQWSGIRNPMSGFLEFDGKWLKFMGSLWPENRRYMREPDVLPQKSVKVLPTVTVYEFANDEVSLTLEFMTPLLPDKLHLIARPVSYISYKITASDGKKHNVRMYFDIGVECCVDDTTETVGLGRNDYSIYCGKGEQDVLKKSGDRISIEWGWLHLAAPDARYMVLKCEDKHNFLSNRDYSEYNGDFVKACDDFPAIACVRKYDNITAAKDFLCIAYNDIYSVEYFSEQLRPYWYENENSFEDEVKKAISEYDEIKTKCAEFNSHLIERARKISDKYADIISLVYRQVIAAHKLIKKDDMLMFFSKECASNGCMGTVDVTYPSIPMFLLLNSDLVEAMLNPVFDYAENRGWHFEFAPHDVGRYPIANGQFYGYREKFRIIKDDMQMPVEECGNMLLCAAAVSKCKNSTDFALAHRKLLAQWADYLVHIGYDPEYQLCTDDFAGRIAHNCNLSVKGILGIAGWGYILNRSGEDGSFYIETAKDFAKKWQKAARTGDHYRLAFDMEDSWSLKYNLVWDKYLGLGIFDDEVFTTEVNFYKTRINQYGIPLDCRKDYTKSDWQMWTTCLTDDIEYRNSIIDAMWELICDMPDRVPFTDWYETKVPHQVEFQNRTVQGGLFFPILMAE